MTQSTVEIEKLLEKVDCRYSLVIIAARRARQLIKDKEITSENPILKVVEEIDRGEVTYHSQY